MSANLLEGRTGKWEVVIGMEVHAQVNAKSKLFSGASTEFGAEPNTQVSLVDAAMPGMLPVINRAAVEQAVRTGLGLQAKINLRSVFDRKNYYYPDLPPGYQISQYKQPVVGEGALVLDLDDGSTKSVGIERVHLEQDAGKSLHDQDPRRTFVDLNRAGVALMEIVSKPDLRSADEAGAYLAKLRSILRYLGTCDGDMEKGNMRADVNVSVRRAGSSEYGTRCEIKNVNSIRFVKQAVEYESRRQIEVLEDGGKIDQETRLFDSARGETRPMRSKEEAHDYRYFPDPDLLPLVLEPTWVEAIKAGLPELPDAKIERLMRRHGLSRYQANLLVADPDDAKRNEALLQQALKEEAPAIYDRFAKGEHLSPPDESVVFVSASSTANLVSNTVVGIATATGQSIGHVIELAELPKLRGLIARQQISTRMAREAIERAAREDRPVTYFVSSPDSRQISDPQVIESEVDKVIAASPAQVAKYKAGETKVAGWFVGQVMKATGGKANPQMVNQLLAKKLGAG